MVKIEKKLKPLPSIFVILDVHFYICLIFFKVKNILFQVKLTITKVIAALMSSWNNSWHFIRWLLEGQCQLWELPLSCCHLYKQHWCSTASLCVSQAPILGLRWTPFVPSSFCKHSSLSFHTDLSCWHQSCFKERSRACYWILSFGLFPFSL